MRLETSLDLLHKTLRSQKLTIGFAESCTGGLLSAELAKRAGVSDVFMGSIISYTNRVKEDLLQISSAILQAHGAVSDMTALQMARGAQKALKCDVALSITGIAGPTGGSSAKPVGTVFISVIGPHFEETAHCRFFGDRTEIQNQSVKFAVQFLLKQLNKE